MNTLRNAGKVKRFHTVETIGQQTVAEHSFNVCLILLFITNGTASSELLKAALYHDLPELITGDIPATAKWKSEALSLALTEVEQRFEKDFDLSVEISDSEKLLLKWADMYELVQYCFDQLRLGNRNMLLIADRGIGYLAAMPCLNNTTAELLFVNARHELRRWLSESE